MTNDKSELLEQLFRLEWLLRYRHMQTHRERGPMGDPHRGQGRILALLKLKPEMSQKELGAILDMRTQSLGELLAKLERQGYIARTPSQADRRAMDIRLTEAGKGAADQGDEVRESDSLFGALSDEEQASLSGYLERLIADWEKQIQAEGGGELPHGPDWRGRGPGRGLGRGHGRPDAPPGFGHFPGGPRRPPFGGPDFGRPDRGEE
jgi:DNA-binding MarR family transcriptional regulator